MSVDQLFWSAIVGLLFTKKKCSETQCDIQWETSWETRWETQCETQWQTSLETSGRHSSKQGSNVPGGWQMRKKLETHNGRHSGRQSFEVRGTLRMPEEGGTATQWVKIETQQLPAVGNKWGTSGRQVLKSGRQAEKKWETSRRQLGRNRETSGRQVEDRWETSGRQVGNKWGTSGISNSASVLFLVLFRVWLPLSYVSRDISLWLWFHRHFCLKFVSQPGFKMWKMH